MPGGYYELTTGQHRLLPCHGCGRAKAKMAKARKQRVRKLRRRMAKAVQWKLDARFVAKRTTGRASANGKECNASIAEENT